MRSLIRSRYLDFFGAFSRPKRGVHILNGHFLDQVDVKNNTQFINFLKDLRSFSEFLNIQDATNLVLSGDCNKFDGVGIAFTFDDGFLDCYTGIAPALNEYNVNACFFVNPNFVDASEEYINHFSDKVVLTPGKEPMRWGHIKELHNSGFVIGNHTLDHLRLSTITNDILHDQIIKSKLIIEKKLNSKVEYFAWPYGQESDISDEALEIISKHHKYIFSGFGYKKYFSFSGKVINRRHFEANWRLSHLKYFLSFSKEYNI